MVRKVDSTLSPIMNIGDKAELKFDLMDNRVIEPTGDDIMNKKWVKALEKVSSSLRSERIEEVIIFRFDQLNPKSQLLLKIAAVAGFHNSPFTAEMLSYILPDFSSAKTQEELFARSAGTDKQEVIFDNDEYSDGERGGESGDRGDWCRGDRAIIKALDQILRESEFIRICKSVQETSDEIDEINLDTDIDLCEGKTSIGDHTSKHESKSYEFTSSLVQATILNLNLRDQNSILHRQTAEYLEKEVLIMRTFHLNNESTKSDTIGRSYSSNSSSRNSVNSSSTGSSDQVSAAQW